MHHEPSVRHRSIPLLVNSWGGWVGVRWNVFSSLIPLHRLEAQEGVRCLARTRMDTVRHGVLSRLLYWEVRTCLARGAVCCCGLPRPLPHYSSPSGPEAVSIQRSSLTSTCALPVFWSARLMCHRTTVAAAPPSRRHSARTFLSYKAGSACSGISNSRSTS